MVGKTFQISKDQMKKVKDNSIPADKVTKIFGDKPSRERILQMIKHRGINYQRKPEIPREMTQQNEPLPHSKKTGCEAMSFDLGNWMPTVKALIPVLEIIKIPSQREKLIKFIEGPSNQEENDKDEPIMLQTITERKDGKCPPFFIYFHINDLILHNCMLDPGVSTNVMPLKVMNKLGLKINRLYRRIFGIDSKKIESIGLIQDL